MGYRSILLITTFLLAGILAPAQGFLREDDLDKKTLKLYEEAKGHLNAVRLEEARSALEKTLQKAPDFLDARLMYADLLLQLKQFEQAEAAFKQAIALAPDYAPLAYYFLAQAEFEQGKYREAAANAGRYLSSGKARGNRQGEAARLQANAAFAAEAVENPVPFEPQSLGPNINTARPEYLPSISADGQALVYTTRVQPNDEDIYISYFQDGAWQPGQPVEELNTPYNESSPSISANGKAMVFASNARNNNFDLYYSRLERGRWSKPERLPPPVNTDAWESQPSLSADGSELYFASNRSGGQGQLDIWMSRMTGSGTWSQPENLGAKINTPLNEQAPFIHPDGQTLYFMSKGHPGMGQYDLFLSRREADGSWGEPQNLGYPINTPNNEGAMAVSLDGRTAYFDTDRFGPTARNQEMGNADLFAFQLPPAARPLPCTYVKARVRDAETLRPLLAEADFIRLRSQASHLRAKTDAEGSFLAVLPLGEDYALNISKEGYFFHSENFALAQAASQDEPFVLDVRLVPIPLPAAATPTAEKPVILKNVFFETGSAALRPESLGELHRLKALLEENPALKIQINGHTDNVGKEEDNLLLSEARAKAVYDYLLGQGIAPGRLRFQGFGPNRPIASNDTPEGRQQNRRTEFQPLQ
jgi:outer membrane protein OmpA-like peptidoglycan-associated protein/tetratricopeptide (TPR) repeat protein